MLGGALPEIQHSRRLVLSGFRTPSASEMLRRRSGKELPQLLNGEANGYGWGSELLAKACRAPGEAREQTRMVRGGWAPKVYPFHVQTRGSLDHKLLSGYCQDSALIALGSLRIPDASASCQGMFSSHARGSAKITQGVTFLSACPYMHFFSNPSNTRTTSAKYFLIMK